LPKLFLRVFYDGSRFYGFQRQPDKETVEGTLLSALREVFPIAIVDPREAQYASASRTDRGVHALAQTIAFNIESTSLLEIEEKIGILNNLLHDNGIIVWAYTLQNAEYHPRHNALYREYLYIERISGCDEEVIDAKKLNRYANLFKGLHDFKHFSLKDKVERKTTRQIYDIVVYEENGYIVYKFVARSYTRGLVRIIISCLKCLSRGTLTIDDVEQAFHDNLTKRLIKAIKPVPSDNLILYNIAYPFSFKLLREYWHNIIEYFRINSDRPVFDYLYRRFRRSPKEVYMLL